jgi:hypothetical protein
MRPSFRRAILGGVASVSTVSENGVRALRGQYSVGVDNLRLNCVVAACRRPGLP